MNDLAIGMKRPSSEGGRALVELPVVLDARVVTGTGGGPDKTILNSARFLVPYGYRTLCAYMHPPEDPGFALIRERARACDAPLLSVADRGPWDCRVVLRLLQICRRERVAIWHGHDYKSNALGLLIRLFWPMKLVTTVHGWGVAGARPLYNRIDRKCLPRYERVICVSEDLRSQCLDCGVRKDRCVVVKNAIDVDQFTRGRGTPEAKAALGLPPDRLVIGAVGRLSGEKGFDVLIRAADLLQKWGRDIELLLVGEGDERPRLEALIAELGREDRVHLLGYRSDTRTLFEAMDVFALSSFSEGLPNVLLEAMALEVPIVATRVGGVPMLIQDERDGLLVEAGSPEGLAQAMDRLLRDDTLRDALRRAGREAVEKSYKFEVRMRKIAALYDELLGLNMAGSRRSGLESP